MKQLLVWLLSLRLCKRGFNLQKSDLILQPSFLSFGPENSTNINKIRIKPDTEQRQRNKGHKNDDTLKFWVSSDRSMRVFQNARTIWSRSSVDEPRSPSTPPPPPPHAPTLCKSPSLSLVIVEVVVTTFSEKREKDQVYRCCSLLLLVQAWDHGAVSFGFSFPQAENKMDKRVRF